jgi:S1-C subfamily serine protease
MADMSRILPISLIALLCGGIAGGIVGAIASDGSNEPATAAAVPAAPAPRAATIYHRDAPGVVVITATETQHVAPTFFTPAQTEKVQALGSGFVIDGKGDILTNDHVVAGGSGIRVGFSGGSTYPARVVGADPGSDLAVVRVDAPASALHPLGFDKSAAVVPGDPVYAIGNPFGLDRTMTAGIVSATGRDIQAPDGLTIPNSIQTDAPINHGNSGGPLLDASGRVVGVNSQIQGGTVDANVGVGFAIPGDTAQSVARQLIDHGHVAHPWLGVSVETIPPGVSSVVRNVPQQGVTVARVASGSPAAKAGLKAATHEVTVDGQTVPLGGDTIVGFDDQPIHSSQDLADAVAQHKPGDHVGVQVVRGGDARTVEVTLGTSPQT